MTMEETVAPATFHSNIKDEVKLDVEQELS